MGGWNWKVLSNMNLNTAHTQSTHKLPHPEKGVHSISDTKKRNDNYTALQQI